MISTVSFLGTILSMCLLQRTSKNKQSKRLAGLGDPHPATQLDEYGGCIFMDYNATTPIFPEVSEQIQPFISEHFGNPSSTHIYSKACRESIASSRETIRQLIGAGSKEEVIFTSCGSESNMMAVHCALNAFQMLRADATDSSSTPHVVTSSIEHPSILNLLHFMEDLGRVTLSVIPVNREGVVDVEAFETAIQEHLPSLALVSLMHANNVVGTVQPVEEVIQAVLRARESKGDDIFPIFHTDASQTLGKFPFSLPPHADMCTIAGHKMGAHKGIGALFLSSSLQERLGGKKFPLVFGAPQEMGWRAGTENVLLINSFGAAAEVITREIHDLVAHYSVLKRSMERQLLESSVDLTIFSLQENEDGEPRPACLSNTICVGFKGLVGSKLVCALRNSVAVSAGSACHSSVPTMLSVLEEMAVDESYGLGAIRISIGRHSSLPEVTEGIRRILETAEQLQQEG